MKQKKTIITLENINNYKGQYLVKENSHFIWMFKFLKLDTKNKNSMLVTQPIDIYPEPRFYTKNNLPNKYNERFFYNTTREVIPTKEDSEFQPVTVGILRTPTKKEFMQYIKYTRAIRILGEPYYIKRKKKFFIK